jgi:hypothetical protein
MNFKKLQLGELRDKFQQGAIDLALSSKLKLPTRMSQNCRPCGVSFFSPSMTGAFGH